jgi:hypothetical protein
MRFAHTLMLVGKLNVRRGGVGSLAELIDLAVKFPCRSIARRRDFKRPLERDVYDCCKCMVCIPPLDVAPGTRL